MRSLPHLLVIFFLTQTHGDSDKISGGYPAEEETFLYFVQLLVGKKLNSSKRPIVYGCGATLIHTKWILTAAYCFTTNEEPKPPLMYFKKNYVQALMGSDEKAQGLNDPKFDIRPLQTAYIHPGYSRQKMKNDVALGELKAGFMVFENDGKTVMLPDKKSILCPRGIVVGAGGDGDFQWTLVEIVQYTTADPKDKTSKNTTFYSQDKEGHAFLGDTGGPYMCYKVQFGIITGNIFDFDKEIVTTKYELVSSHMEFITSYVDFHTKWRGGSVGAQETKSSIDRVTSDISFIVSFYIAVKNFLFIN
ncbi:hypothetical protein ILUMI_23994 [Ignelater luminosus]|uniref:Peptidase S1 domain-containing protein n=1 Tax=Ignelater luminosus TaxID=2038154 RepID=A0A8K0CCU2_IGNLU|nr:hypothetical protein ILUMI_23994 [Ignelater luminosus]